MGVNQLWSILGSVKAHKTLKSLKGQTIVVDLSVWICESSSALQGLPVAKPHLRNLFFRVTNLTQLGVNLIFVLDGEPPELKWDEMERRTKARFEGGARGRWGHWRSKRSKTTTGVGAGGKKKKERKRFKFVVKECQEMLETLGVPCVQAAGEAEAMCALMNIQGLADACLTEDGDVFLYGARTVYKNFTLNSKDPHIECYSMNDIESRLGLNQRKLVALGLLLGCDYTPGVLGVGPKLAVGMMRQLGAEVDVLDRFRDWAVGKVPRNCSQEGITPKKPPHCSRCTHVGSGREHKTYGCAMCNSDVACQPKSAHTPECSCLWHVSGKTSGKASLEADVMKKACATPDFPSEPVIDEFLSVRDKCPKTQLSWRRPQLISAQKLVSSKLEWPEEYTVEKIFPLVTLWDLAAISSGQSFDPRRHLTPAAVVKKRVRQGVACVEVRWKTEIPHSALELPTTIENEKVFTQAFPCLMKDFEEAKAAKTKSKRKKTGGSNKDSSKDKSLDDHRSNSNEDDLDDLTKAVGGLSLLSHPQTQLDNILSSSVCDLHSDDVQDLSDLSEAEEDCSSLPLSLFQRLKLLPCSRGPGNIHVPNSDATESNPANISKQSDAEEMSEAVRQRSQRSQSVSVIGRGDIKPIIKSSTIGKMRSLNDSCGEDANVQDMDWPFPDLRCSSISSAEDRPPTSSAKEERVIKHIEVTPLHRNPSRSETFTAASEKNVSSSAIEADAIDAEPLPLSERLRLKKAVETVTLDDSSCSSSADDEGTSHTTFSIASLAENSAMISTLEAESFHNPLSPLAEDITEIPSSSYNSHSPANGEDANFSLGFELTKMLWNDDTLLETKERVSHSQTSDQDSSSIDHSSSSVGGGGGPKLQMQLSVSPSHQEQLRTGQTEPFSDLSSNTEVPSSVPRATTTLHKLSVEAAHEWPSFTPNFSLKFDMTDVLSEDESLLQRNETSGADDARRHETARDANASGKSELPAISKDVKCGEMFVPVKVQNGNFSGSQERDQTSLDMIGGKSEIRTSGDTPTGEADNENQVNDTDDISLDFKEKLRCFLQKFQEQIGRPGRKGNLGGNLEEMRSVLLPGDEGGADECDNYDSLGGLESGSPRRCLSTCGGGLCSSQTPALDLCHTVTPLPIDVDTPMCDNESFLGAFNQSESSRPRAGQDRQLVTTPVSHLPRKFKDLNLSRTKQGACQQITANYKPEFTANNRLASILNEVENSPISLLDRLKRRHGNQNGVLSALATKKGHKFGGKPTGDRHVLMEIFDDDNDADDVSS